MKDIASSMWQYKRYRVECTANIGWQYKKILCQRCNQHGATECCDDEETGCRDDEETGCRDGGTAGRQDVVTAGRREDRMS
jgi:hypothetical protein